MNMQPRPGELNAMLKGLPEMVSSEAMMALPKAQMRTWLELVSFSSRRTRAYLDIPSQLAACTSVQDIVQAQTKFWETAFGQYNQTAHAIAGIWGSLLPAATVATRTPAPVPRDLITFPEPAAEPGPRRTGREAA